MPHFAHMSRRDKIVALSDFTVCAATTAALVADGVVVTHAEVARFLRGGREQTADEMLADLEPGALARAAAAWSLP